MKHNVTLLKDKDYDLNDDLPVEVDLESMKVDVERTQRFRVEAVLRQLQLDPDVIEFFKTPKAINEALRKVMNEQLKAA
ncbi:MAG TPA: hypothetical protein PLK30_13485 [Blastocatellia bacterium]|nr:hypothetical protein [Blastocatellia bacterium]